MKTELQIAAWWIAFGGTHIVGSTVLVRRPLIRALGLLGFKGLYSLVALATFVPLCWFYATHKHAGELLWNPSPALSGIAQAIMLLAVILLFQGLLNPTTETERRSSAASFFTLNNLVLAVANL